MDSRSLRVMESLTTEKSENRSPMLNAMNASGKSHDHEMLERAYGAYLPVTKERKRSSQVLEELFHQAPVDHFTLGWLLSNLHRRSFGVVMLFLGLLATTPIGSTVPGLMLVAVAVQMIVGRREPVFPRFIIVRSLPTQYLLRLGKGAVPILRYLEKAVHPRWPTAFEVGKQFVGIIVLLLTGVLLLTPVPFSNIAPSLSVVVISLAYIEEDGMLLCVAFLAAVILICIAAAAMWGAIFSALLIGNI